MTLPLSRVLLPGAAALLSITVALAQPTPPLPPDETHRGGTTTSRQGTGGAPNSCAELATHQAAFQRELGSLNARLDQLVARMNAATGPAKVDAVAAVLTELVAQQRTMQARAHTLMAMQADCGGTTMGGSRMDRGERTGAASGDTTRDDTGDASGDASTNRTDPADTPDPRRGNQPGDDAGRTEHGDPQKPR